MSTKLIMRREGQHLVPVAEFVAEDMARIPLGRDVEVEVTLARNLNQLRYIWALATFIGRNQDALHDKDDAMDVLCTLAHHVDVVVNPLNGHEYIRRRSLKLPQDEMGRLMDRMVYVTLAQVLPGMQENDLRRAIEEMCTGDQRSKNVSGARPKQIERAPELEPAE